jgi:hypothetical protein
VNSILEASSRWLQRASGGYTKKVWSCEEVWAYEIKEIFFYMSADSKVRLEDMMHILYSKRASNIKTMKCGKFSQESRYPKIHWTSRYSMSSRMVSSFTEVPRNESWVIYCMFSISARCYKKPSNSARKLSWNSLSMISWHSSPETNENSSAFLYFRVSSHLIYECFTCDELQAFSENVEDRDSCHKTIDLIHRIKISSAKRFLCFISVHFYLRNRTVPLRLGVVKIGEVDTNTV